MDLSPPAARVLGALIEKSLATPQHYPLSVNALISACNQSTNREPVTDYDEDAVRAALDELRAEDLCKASYARGSRVARHEHLLAEFYDLQPCAVAILALLLLRGPQTIGELRSRTERLHAFDSPEEVQTTLAELEHHPYDRLVAPVARQPGQKEVRYTQLLCDLPTPPLRGLVQRHVQEHP